MRKLLPLLLGAALFLLSCTKEDGHQQPPQPAGYADLYAAYSENLRYTDISHNISCTTITLEDKSVVKLYLSDITVYDCRGQEPGVTKINQEGEWMLDGQPLGIWVDNMLSDANAIPIYIYYTEDALYARLNNHGTLTLESVDPAVLGALPVIRITTANGQAVHAWSEDYVTGTMSISDPDGKYSSEKAFTSPVRIRARGNSTRWMDKMPYRIKLDEKASIFGIHKDKDWILLAEYTDKSLIRNISAMEISRRIGMPWTPEMRSCELYLNGQCKGVYTFSEHKEVSGHKIDIDTENGDILLEVDENQDNPVSWVTAHGTPMMFSDPEEPTEEQIAMVKQYFIDIETALWDKDFATVYKMLDRDSFVNNYIIQELTKNVDGNFRRSNLMTLVKGGKLSMCLAWDFDLSLGNSDCYGTPPGNGPEGWWVKDHGSWGRNQGWYYRLFMDPEFAEAVKQRWQEVYPLLKDLPDYMDLASAMIGEEAVKRNFTIWSITENGWWNASRTISTYEGEISYLKTFYTKRLEWLNEEIEKF